jgi:hypothetical protein
MGNQKMTSGPTSDWQWMIVRWIVAVLMALCVIGYIWALQ